jgi:hypothetical protein
MDSRSLPRPSSPRPAERIGVLGGPRGEHGGSPMVGPFAGMAVTSLVLALGTGVVLATMVARGTEILAHAARGRQRRMAGARPCRPGRAWSVQGGTTPE